MASDTEPVENLGLTFRRCPAVTAHCRNDEWFSAAGFHGISNAGQELDEPPDTSTSRGYSDPISRPDLFAQAKCEELAPDVRSDVFDVI